MKFENTSCPIHLANIGVCPITERVVVIDLHNVSAIAVPAELSCTVDHMLPESIQNPESILGKQIKSF